MSRLSPYNGPRSCSTYNAVVDPPCWCLQVGQCLPHPARKEEELQTECNKNLYEQAMLAMQRAPFYEGAERRAFLQASLLPFAIAS